MIELRAFATKEQLARAAADLVLATALEALTLRGRFLWALSGGGTPGPLYEQLLKSPYREQFPWAETHFCWGDERLVPPNDPGSNYGQAWQTFLGVAPVPAGHIHRIPGELPPDWAALAYCGTLALLAGPAEKWPRFDLVLLGLGNDGHTASLFPGQQLPEPLNRPASAVTGDYDGRPAHRVTLTPFILNEARQLLFLATGREKAAAVAATLEGEADPLNWPAQRLHPRQGDVHWYVAEGADEKLRASQAQK